jgi:hypothetical protein
MAGVVFSSAVLPTSSSAISASTSDLRAASIAGVKVSTACAVSSNPIFSFDIEAADVL